MGSHLRERGRGGAGGSAGRPHFQSADGSAGGPQLQAAEDGGARAGRRVARGRGPGEREEALPLALPLLLLALQCSGLGCPREGLVARVWSRGRRGSARGRGAHRRAPAGDLRWGRRPWPLLPRSETRRGARRCSFCRGETGAEWKMCPFFTVFTR